MAVFESDVTLDPVIKKHIEEFYRLSDVKGKEGCEGWTSCFTEDGLMKRGGIDVKGHEALLSTITNSWENMTSRQHIIYKVYPFGPSQAEVMLYGESKWNFEDGSKSGITWAARLHFVRIGDGVKIDFYQIYSTPKPKA